MRVRSSRTENWGRVFAFGLRPWGCVGNPHTDLSRAQARSLVFVQLCVHVCRAIVCFAWKVPRYTYPLSFSIHRSSDGGGAVLTAAKFFFMRQYSGVLAASFAAFASRGQLLPPPHVPVRGTVDSPARGPEPDFNGVLLRFHGEGFSYAALAVESKASEPVLSCPSGAGQSCVREANYPRAG